MLLLLRFNARTVREQIISLTAIKTGALINILRADLGARRGELIVEVPDQKATEVLEILKKMGVEIQKITKLIAKNENCINCGVCVSICPTEVFISMVKIKWRSERRSTSIAGHALKFAQLLPSIFRFNFFKHL